MITKIEGTLVLPVVHIYLTYMYNVQCTYIPNFYTMSTSFNYSPQIKTCLHYKEVPTPSRYSRVQRGKNSNGMNSNVSGDHGTEKKGGKGGEWILYYEKKASILLKSKYQIVCEL